MNLDQMLEAAATDVRRAAEAVPKRDMGRMASRMRNQRIFVAASAAAAIAVIVGAIVWLLPQADIPPAEDLPPVTTTTEALAELDPAWLESFVAFAENRHEADFLNYEAIGFGNNQAIADDALDRRQAYQFTAQCSLLEVFSNHLDEAPAPPDNPAIAEEYQQLLDLEEERWANQQELCDSVDHDDVRAGTVAPDGLFVPEGSSQTPGFIRSAEQDFFAGNQACKKVVDVIEQETGQRPEVICRPAPGWSIDRDLPEDFADWVGPQS
jgi:hypothetical protein